VEGTDGREKPAGLVYLFDALLADHYVPLHPQQVRLCLGRTPLRIYD